MNTKISKTMSYLLRHGADKEGLNIGSDGYVLVDDLINNKALEQLNVNENTIIQIVNNDTKNRYNLTTKNNKLYIRANQGHSINVQNLDLIEITDSSQIPICVHGTYHEAWNIIKKEGLNKMARNHIHFAQGLPNQNVTSGMRINSQIAIYLNVEKAMNDGIKFYKSQNGVILSSGDLNGTILPKYFKDVIDMRTNRKLI